MYSSLFELKSQSQAIIFEARVGSFAYGTNNENSDIDIKGLFVYPLHEYLKIDQPLPQISDDKNNSNYYSLHRFAQLAAISNPNFIELLFLPEDCVLKTSAYFNVLQDSRREFISKDAYHTHVNYALAQIKKAKGRNKWINNPKPIEVPKKEDYCWYIPKHSENPFRPIALAKSGVDINQCHVASLEHGDQFYRLYEIGSKANGVFKNNEIKCESISIEEERKCIGLLIFNQRQYEKDIKDHGHYHEWKSNRNDARWSMQERKGLDYDTKNMMHTFRLLMSAEGILKEGEPAIRFYGNDLEFLMSIREGKFAYNDLIFLAEEKVRQLEILFHNSSLPEKADRIKIDQLILEITSGWESQYGSRN